MIMSDQLLTFIQSLEPLPPVQLTSADVPTGPSIVTDEAGWVTTDQPMGHVQDFDDVVTFGVDSEIWPGSVLQGARALDPAPGVVPVKRAPLTITLSGPVTANGASMSAVIADPSVGTVQDAVNKLLQQPNVANAPAKLDVDAFQAYSDSQLCARAGLNAQFVGGAATAKMSAAIGASRATFVATVTQTYYEVSASAPGPTNPYFDPAVTVDGVRPYMKDGNPPVYVSSVVYGRRLVLLLTSQTRKEDYSAEVNGSYIWGAGSAAGSASGGAQNTVSQLHITLLDIGGSTDSAVRFLEASPNDPAQLNHLAGYLRQGATWSLTDSPGAIIGWKLRYVGDTSSVITSTPVQYNRRTYAAKSRNVDLGEVIHQDASGRAPGDDWTHSYPFYPSPGMHFDVGSVQAPYVVLRGSASVTNVDAMPERIVITVYTQSVNRDLFGGHHSGEIAVKLKYREYGVDQ
jgi:Thiol-activated cytolysin